MAKSKPTPIGELIDALYEARARRLALSREVDELKATETAVKAGLMEMLHEMKSTKAAGQVASITLLEKTVPKVEDWKKLYAFIYKHKAFELLHQRIASTAWSEMVDAGKTVPGVEAVPVEDLSINKLSKS